MAGIIIIFFLLNFIAGNFNRGKIINHDKIARVNMLGKPGFILAPQNHRDNHGQLSQRDPGGIVTPDEDDPIDGDAAVQGDPSI